MRPTAIAIIVLCVLGSPSGFADEDQSVPHLRRTLREFVTSQFSHGVPYPAARALGPTAIPVLKDLLADESLNWYRSEILITIAFSGDERGFDILRSFIVDTFRGSVDTRTYQALITAQVAIGFVKSSKTIPYLEKGCDPKFWRRIHWSYVGDSGDELALTLSQRSILGLSWTEDAKAEKILKRLEARPYHERQTASIKEAIERFDDIRALGMEEYQSMAGTLRPRGVSPLKPMAPETPEHQEK